MSRSGVLAAQGVVGQEAVGKTASALGVAAGGPRVTAPTTQLRQRCLLAHSRQTAVTRSPASRLHAAAAA